MAAPDDEVPALAPEKREEEAEVGTAGNAEEETEEGGAEECLDASALVVVGVGLVEENGVEVGAESEVEVAVGSGMGEDETKEAAEEEKNGACGEKKIEKEDWPEAEELGKVVEAQRPNKPHCAYFLMTGRCSSGEGCKFNHPPRREKYQRESKLETSIIDKEEIVRGGDLYCGGENLEGKCSNGMIEDMVWRGQCPDDSPMDGDNLKDKLFTNQDKVPYWSSWKDDQPDCVYYLAAGKCAYGDQCRFKHVKKQIYCVKVTKKDEHECRNEVAEDGWGSDGDGTCNDKFEDKVNEECKKTTYEDSKVEIEYGNDEQVKDEGWSVNEFKESDDSYYPQRPYAVDCAHYLRTGKCAYGKDCKFNHPHYVKQNQVTKIYGEHECGNEVIKDGWGSDGDESWNNKFEDKVKEGWTKATREDRKVEYDNGGWVKDEGWSVNEDKSDDSYYPQRPHVADCSHYLRTGKCAYGRDCKFNHPHYRKQKQTCYSNVTMKQAVHMDGKWDLDKDPRRKVSVSQIEVEREDKWEDWREDAKVARANEFWDKDQKQMAGNEAEGFLPYEYPQRPNEPDCPYYLHTGTCAYGSTCKFNHPSLRKQIRYNLTPPGYQPGNDYRCGHSKVRQEKKETKSKQLNSFGFPLRPGKRECSYYMQNGTCKFSIDCCYHHPEVDIAHGDEHHMAWKGRSSHCKEYNGSDAGTSPRHEQTNCQHFMRTGDCKFGSACRFRHPPKEEVLEDCLLSPIGLPLRPGQTVCTFYEQKGICKFGPICRYDHPLDLIS